MKTKILDSLKTKYSNLGFSSEVLGGVATQLSTFVTKEEDIATAVAGAEPMLKMFQSFTDSRVNTYKTEAETTKTKLAELEKKLKEFEDFKGEKGSGSGGSTPEYVKQMQKQMEDMQKALLGFQAQQNSLSFKNTFIEKMKEKEVPELYFNNSLIGREFKSNEDVEALANAVAQGYEQFKQDAANMGFNYVKPPENGQGGEDKEINDLVDSIKKGTEELTKK